eukprot:Blabericola_migrator_1__679@NODE_1169_length_5223_cov_356_775989_g795_i0_p3_GENE_NODE_1169_length_5223_cov_356_775989_g795_i0NODE_1169_length_5223_cov_356_775989_g795_i0_p3_ORF_typecomplete_len108_score18_47_NODE_1169_length_5223_cov_356_775989_g795_i07631086
MRLLYSVAVLTVCGAEIPVPAPLFPMLEPLNGFFQQLTGSDYQIFTKMSSTGFSGGQNGQETTLIAQDDDRGQEREVTDDDEDEDGDGAWGGSSRGWIDGGWSDGGR